MDASGLQGSLRRVCGLDEFTLASIPKYDPIWGRRNPCGCVWTDVNTDTQATGQPEAQKSPGVLGGPLWREEGENVLLGNF